MRKKQRAVPISTPSDSSVSQSPQWSDRFRQLRRSIQGRGMKNSVSPQPAEKVPTFEDLPPKPTPRQRSRSTVKQSPYDEAAPPPIHRTTLTVEASKVSSDNEQPDEKDDGKHLEIIQLSLTIFRLATKASKIPAESLGYYK